MGIFDDVVVNAKSAASVVSKKAGVIYDVSKLKITAAGIRGELNKKFKAYGEAIYNGEPEEKVAELKSQIDELKVSLNEINEVLAASRKDSVCPECGAAAVKGAQFCYLCGAQLPTETNLCKSCGAELRDDCKFCIICGTPVDETVDDNSDDEE